MRSAFDFMKQGAEGRLTCWRTDCGISNTEQEFTSEILLVSETSMFESGSRTELRTLQKYRCNPVGDSHLNCLLGSRVPDRYLFPCGNEDVSNGSLIVERAGV